MQLIDRIRCQIGWHQWSRWIITETHLDPITGHDTLDLADEDFIVETHTRKCKREHCGQDHIKQVLKW